MKNEIVIVRTGIPPQQLDKYADEETKLHEAAEGLRTLASIAKPLLTNS